jgi:D-arabinose 1-dehydrogenase-like Zn-dependent alcohol dehydrogenase
MATVPFQEWIDLCAKGAMNTNLDKTFKLDEAAEAHEYMEANKVRPVPLSRILRI